MDAMADPVSAAASILAIVGACATCTEHLYKVIVALKDAPEEAAQVARDLYHSRNAFIAVQELYETRKFTTR